MVMCSSDLSCSIWDSGYLCYLVTRIAQLKSALEVGSLPQEGEGGNNQSTFTNVLM